MAKIPQYRTLKKGPVKKTKAEATAWAKEEKARRKAVGTSVRIEVDYLESRKAWQARLLSLVKT